MYRYLDYRAFLRDWFAARQAKDPQFSRRQFARLAGRSSPGFLTEVTDGGRQLTAPVVTAVAQALDLSRAESEFFEALVQLDQAEDTRTRNHAWDRISAVRAFQEARKIEGASFRYLSSWWFPVVRELAHRADFQPDPAWIAKRVRPVITEAQARQALETLEALGLLVRSDGDLVPVDAVVATAHEVGSLAVHNYHTGMLERAIESIDRFPAEERHLVAATVSVPASLVPKLKQELNAFQQRILDLCAQFDEPVDQVLQIHLVLFPLSDRAGE
ncbi:MAG: TIGR02147 family protein [Myxococcota bacterium]